MGEALIGLLGAVIGSAATIVGVFVKDYLATKRQKKLDDDRKEMLTEMLENMPPGKEWRDIQTLSRVVGADYAETTRLLIELGARGSQGENDVWALRSKKPL